MVSTSPLVWIPSARSFLNVELEVEEEQWRKREAKKIEIAEDDSFKIKNLSCGMDLFATVATYPKLDDKLKITSFKYSESMGKLKPSDFGNSSTNSLSLTLPYFVSKPHNHHRYHHHSHPMKLLCYLSLYIKPFSYLTSDLLGEKIGHQ
ncbi:hypothetical protein VNO78_05469 [Psophocarpus tetragonolobus]|uniref:Uncharacterized protein n=1 Tax=Psophocarpus tetragonolobus TaxID=3891 RepID=A0AAN9SSX0_PSOTE